MYIYSKAVEAVFNSFVSRGFLKPIPNGESIVFAICGGLLFYNSVLEPYNLRRSYWNFLVKASNGRYNQFEPVARTYKPQYFKKTGFTYSH